MYDMILFRPHTALFTLLGTLMVSMSAFCRSKGGRQLGISTEAAIADYLRWCERFYCLRTWFNKSLLLCARLGEVVVLARAYCIIDKKLEASRDHVSGRDSPTVLGTRYPIICSRNSEADPTFITKPSSVLRTRPHGDRTE